MKILYVVPDLVVGGVSTVVLSNIKELKKRGCLIELVTMKTIIDPKSHDDISYKSLNINSPKDVFRSLTKFEIIIKKFKPDIIHSHTYNANMLVRIHSLIYNSKIVKICNEHGTYRKGANVMPWFLFKVTRKIPDYFANVSHSSLKSYINNGLCNPKKCVVLYNGIELDKFKKNKELGAITRSKYSLTEEQILFGYVGRLSKEKDVSNLLQAVKILKDISRKDFKLIIVGDGPESNGLINFVNLHNLNDKVFFIGEKNDVIPYLSMIDILVLPSKTEGLPTVLLEAMAMECMIVSTNCGGVQEILNGTKSYIAPIENPYQLANQMNKVLTLDPEVRKVYGKDYRNKIISTFSINNTVNEIYNLYFSILYKDNL